MHQCCKQQQKFLSKEIFMFFSWDFFCFCYQNKLKRDVEKVTKETGLNDNLLNSIVCLNLVHALPALTDANNFYFTLHEKCF